MSDIFNEVDDELRQEKIKEFWDENKYFIIGSIIAAILFTAGFVMWQDWKYQKDMENTSKLYKALNTSDVNNLIEYSKNAPSKHVAIAKLSAVTIYLNNGKRDEALGILKEIRQDRNIDKIYRSLASLVAANLLIDTADEVKLSQIKKTLIPLTKKNGAWRYSAKETLMAIAAKQQDYKTAIKIAEELIEDSNTMVSMKERLLKLKKLYKTKLSSLDNNNEVNN